MGGDPEEQEALLKEDLDEPAMAYAQHYAVQVWPQPHFAHLPSGARAIDAFIGEPDMIGHGHGSAFLRLVALSLQDNGAPVVAIDPDAANLRARRAYAKAGFKGEAVSESGEGPVVVMTFEG